MYTYSAHYKHLPVSFLCEDRVVDDLNPVLNFTRKEVESLLHFVEEEPEAERVLLESQLDLEPVIHQACQLYPNLITKVQCMEDCAESSVYMRFSEPDRKFSFFIALCKKKYI